MIIIDDILVDEEIAETRFSCDLGKCKGGCCTFPGQYGAPVKDSEVSLMKEAMQAAWPLLPEIAKQTIEREGFVQGEPGDYTTVCIGGCDCVFVYYEGDIALCALEKAYLDGKTTFRKPISCHLFPIRVRKFSGTYLYYEEIDECESALAHGTENGTMMHECVKDALIRAYGEDWYKELDDFVKTDDC